MRTRLLAGVLLAASVAGGAAVAQQLPRPSFKADVKLVRIDVTVLDDKRRPVRGLQASDFTVVVDGQPRPIRAFQPVDRTVAPSLSAGATATVTTDNVATNREGDDTSRLILIMMDRSIPS